MFIWVALLIIYYCDEHKLDIGLLGEIVKNTLRLVFLKRNIYGCVGMGYGVTCDTVLNVKVCWENLGESSSELKLGISYVPYCCLKNKITA